MRKHNGYFLLSLSLVASGPFLLDFPFSPPLSHTIKTTDRFLSILLPSSYFSVSRQKEERDFFLQVTRCSVSMSNNFPLALLPFRENAPLFPFRMLGSFRCTHKEISVRKRLGIQFKSCSFPISNIDRSIWEMPCCRDSI